MSLSIALVGGFWAQNIGNAFFNLGGKYALEQAFPGARVNLIQDQPGGRTFHPQEKGNPRNALELLRYIEADCIVIQGPMLRRGFGAMWNGTFRALRARGTKVILLGAGLFRYDAEEIAESRALLDSLRPDAVLTRDSYTYAQIKDICPLSYDGIDCAFFVPCCYDPFPLTLPPYIAMNFDQYPEPRIKLGGSRKNGSTSALGADWMLEQPRLQMKLSSMGQVQGYLGALFDYRKLPDRINGHLIVRTEHRTNPFVARKVYGKPNTVASDEPYTYLSIYANAQMVLSDRVHACVAALAYGTPAMLFSPTGRARLLDRVGADRIREEPVCIERTRLDAEREALIDQLRTMGEYIFA